MKNRRKFEEIRMDTLTSAGRDIDEIERKRMFIEAIKDGCNYKEACGAAKIDTKEYQRWIKEDGIFVDELEYALDYDIRIAKSKVREGLEKDDCEEFALKVLKAKRPNEYGTQNITTNQKIEAEVEYKNIDEMLLGYYNE